MWTPKKESKFRNSQMSRKEVAAAVACSTTSCKSKQFPRFFRNRRASSVSLVWPYVDVNAGSVISEQIETSSLTSLPDESKKLLIEDKNNKFKTKNHEEGNGYTEIVWCLDHSSTFLKCIPSEVGAGGIVDDPEDKTGDVETVASIEKWLKARTESVSSMELDVTKLEVEENVERYLTNDLTHSFLPKDPDTLSIDIDLSDKKLNLSYEHSILQELQTEKLLGVCEKDDEFILPEFRLDQLDPLALSPDDMMVAGEILPSTSGSTSLTTPNEHLTDTSNKSEKERVQLIDQTEDTENHTSMVDSTELTNLPIVFENINVMQDTPEANNIVSSPKSVSNSFTDVLDNDDVIENTTNVIDVANSGNNIMQQLKSKARIKLEPRIIKKRRRISDKFDEKIKSKEGVMTVVAISTDKISNMTQIVINTGTEEQIYQGKTSELIEATGNFPKLPRIETSPAWSGSLECNSEMNPSSQHEMIISNALAELGVTDDNLQPVTVSEHGKLWLCPKEGCDKQFNRLYALKGHLLSHYGVRPFKCDNEGCTWAFYSEFKLKRHKETHSKRKDYACQVEGCNRRFTTIYNLWSHQKLHTRPNRIKCHVPDCQEKFQTKRALELHMRSHDQSHAPYVCKHEGCGKRYYSSNALTSHQRCHSYKEIDVKCSWPGCGKVFDKPCRLKAHIRSHTGCKPYLCTFQGCQWAFSSSSKLKRHQKKHTNERKFICDVASCGKAFMRSEHLKEHRLTHKEGRYFQCCICNTQFSAKSSLYVHIKKHQNKEEIERNISKQTFSESSSIKNRFIMTESRCSKANPFVTQKKKSIELNKDLISQNASTPVLSQPCESSLNNDDENQSLEMISNQDEIKTLYHCPVETCTRSYSTKATLRAHMSKIHGTPIGDCDKSLKSKSTNVIDFNNMDYVLYAPPSSASESTEQMVMVTPCDTVVVNNPSEMDSLPETQPPLLDIVLRNDSIHENATNEQLLQSNVKKNHGSARTNLTFSDVCKLKTKGAPMSSIAGASDVTLGASDMKGELLFTEELPSMYYQDDVGGTEYQVLLLDSGPSESAVNLRGLE
ncbi:PREDICTED: zinc finger protein 184-like isoform X1 [Polistes canadensis]|uniref:zinc finger protein 184-like isoform X1 n=1 Tax=Polistes canadensis TaxID=91411 RepID=UPI000718F37D|nr:PREDICTED: zinc finger protein 184-like isoform X1 [Polistes canadensis]